MAESVFLWENIIIKRILPIRQRAKPTGPAHLFHYSRKIMGMAPDQANPPPLPTIVSANAPGELIQAFGKTPPPIPLIKENVTNHKTADEGAS
jgi:hypothetical protein